MPSLFPVATKAPSSLTSIDQMGECESQSTSMESVRVLITLWMGAW